MTKQSIRLFGFGHVGVSEMLSADEVNHMGFNFQQSGTLFVMPLQNSQSFRAGCMLVFGAVKCWVLNGARRTIRVLQWCVKWKGILSRNS